MADKPTIPAFPTLPDFGQMITQACEVVASVRGIPYDFSGTLSLENKFVVLFKSVKEMCDAQDELVKSYKALYDFVNQFFTNLDLQNEVNKKIEEIKDSGELLNLLKPTVNSEVTAWLTANITNPSNPPIDKSLTVENAAADAKVTGDKINSVKEDLSDYCGVTLPSYEKKTNTYINNNGYVSHSGYETSVPIAVEKGNLIKLTATGYLTNIVMINMCDESGNLSLSKSDRVWSSDSTRKTYSFIVPRKGYVVVSGVTSTIDLKILNHISNVILKNDIDDANKIINASNLTPLSITEFESGYITSYGTVAPNSSFVYSKPIKLYKNQVVKSLVQGYLTQVSLVSRYNNDGTYTPLVVSTDNNEKTLIYNIKSDGKYVFCTNVNVAYDYKIYIDCSALLQAQETINFMTIFHKLGVIGDSLASGEIVRNDEYIDRYEFSWLSNIARRNGLKCEHYSKGGMTAKNWLNNTGSLYDKFQNDDELASAIFIALGTNDISADYSVGNSTDTAGSNSFCGYVKKIIETVRTKNPNCVIFMVSLYSLTDTSKIYSNAIRDLSKLYELCYFVNYADNSNGVVTESTDWNISRYGHFTTTSYVVVSNIIEKLCNDIVNINQNTFGYFGLDNN